MIRESGEVEKGQIFRLGVDSIKGIVFFFLLTKIRVKRPNYIVSINERYIYNPTMTTRGLKTCGS